MQFDFFRQFSDRPIPTVERPKRVTRTHVSEDAKELEKIVRDLLRPLGCPEFAARVRVRWNARMRSTAGTAHAGKCLITLNPRLRDFGDAEVDRTLRHELAHLLAHFRAGRRRISPHGREWQQACRDLGLADEKRCHDLPLPRREMTARHFYRCPHCAVVLSRVRPLRGKSACLACCREHNRGHYAERFRFTRINAPVAQA
jgi:predicted SprT family Zn-dependent metalloprotease